MTFKLSLAIDDQRQFERHRVPAIMPVKMLRSGSERSLSCRIFDVSTAGLCVLLREPLPEGEVLVLVTLYGRYKFIVAWCGEAENKEHRCGLVLQDAQSDLRQVFSKFLAAKQAG